MADTKIEWTDKSWNCIRGCSLVSDGCRNCYAMRQAHRFSGEGQPYHGLTVLTSTGPKWNGDITLVPDKLGEPLHWKKPARIFVNSMSDVFHEGVDDSYIDRIFGVMQMCPQHIFQILTKRPERMMKYMNEPGRGGAVMLAAEREAFDEDTLVSRGGTLPKAAEYATDPPPGELLIRIKGGTWPPPNVWLGTSVENQKTANERIPYLCNTKAAVHWLSIEPLLAPVSIHFITRYTDEIKWVVVGGESGPGARPIDPDWVRLLRDQCAATGTPFFFKQWGEYLPTGQRSVGADGGPIVNITDKPAKLGKHLAGRLLDGREWNEYPQV